MNMMVSAAAMASVAQLPTAEASADNAADAGAQFERLIVEYVDIGLESARLFRAARAAHREKFGAHRDDNLTSEGRARWAALEEIFASNGYNQASQKSCDLYEAMTPLAEKIKGAPVAGMADLRARTLVSLWEALPSDMYNEGSLNFYSEYDGGAIRSMFDAAVTLTGLQPLVSDVEQRLAAGAAAEPAMPSEPPPPSDTDLIDAHQEIEELDRKISAALKQHGDDANEHPDYLKLEDERYEAIDLLSSTAAHSVRGICAKASTLKMREVLEDYARTRALAESLAADVLRLSGVARA
jgi:hypothetical protein